MSQQNDSYRWTPPEGTFREGHVPKQGWMCIEYALDGHKRTLPFTGEFQSGAAATAWVKYLEQAAHLSMDSFIVRHLR